MSKLKAKWKFLKGVKVSCSTYKSRILFFLANSRMKSTPLRRKLFLCLYVISFLHLLGQLQPPVYLYYSRGVASPQTCRPGPTNIGLISLPLVINYALLGWAKKLKSSRCWWGHCVLVARPKTSQRKTLATLLYSIRYILWGLLVNLTSRVWNFFLMILSEFYVSVFCPNVKYRSMKLRTSNRQEKG